MHQQSRVRRRYTRHFESSSLCTLLALHSAQLFVTEPRPQPDAACATPNSDCAGLWPQLPELAKACLPQTPCYSHAAGPVACGHVLLPRAWRACRAECAAPAAAAIQPTICAEAWRCNAHLAVHTAAPLNKQYKLLSRHPSKQELVRCSPHPAAYKQ